MRPDELLDSDAAAERLGWRVRYLRTYRSSGRRPLFPPPDATYGRSPVWLPETLAEFRRELDARPGRTGRPRTRPEKPPRVGRTRRPPVGTIGCGLPDGAPNLVEAWCAQVGQAPTKYPSALSETLSAVANELCRVGHDELLVAMTKSGRSTMRLLSEAGGRVVDPVRRVLALDAVLRVELPVWVERADCPGAAARLRDLAPVDSFGASFDAALTAAHGALAECQRVGRYGSRITPVGEAIRDVVAAPLCVESTQVYEVVAGMVALGVLGQSAETLESWLYEATFASYAVFMAMLRV